MGLTDKLGDYKLRANDYAGRMVFGNSVRFSDNVLGRVNRFRSRVSSDVGYSANGSGHIDDLRELSYAELGTPYPQELLAEVRSAFEAAIEDDDKTEVRGTGEYEGTTYSKNIARPREHAPVFFELLTDEVLDLVGRYFRSNVELVHANPDNYVSAWRNIHIPDHVVDKIGISGYWHCDRQPADRLKLFVYASDVDTDCGPFTLVTRPETKRLVRKYGYSEARRNELGAPGGFVREHAVTIDRLTGPAGTAALCNTQECLHRAGIPAEGRHRDLIQFQFRASSTPLEEQLDRILG